MPGRSQSQQQPQTLASQSQTTKLQKEAVVVPRKRAKKQSQKGAGGGQTQSESHANTMSNSQQSQSTSINTNGKRGRGSGKGSHSRTYPRGIGVDFRRLSSKTLIGYIDHHGLNVRNDAPNNELAVAVARHFENMEVVEQDVIGGFLSRLSSPTSKTYTRATSYFDGQAPTEMKIKRRHAANAARPEEQVAAKVTRTDENGSWILASVVRFYPDTECYDVQDEDEKSKYIRLPWNHVMRLSNGDEGCFVKGTHVMAIFPETTSFYRAVVSKQPVWKLAQGSKKPIVKELILKFEDDEDENGRTPFRRVPSRYVIPVPSKYFYEEDEDVDLNPPLTNTNI